MFRKVNRINNFYSPEGQKSTDLTLDFQSETLKTNFSNCAKPRLHIMPDGQENTHQCIVRPTV